MHSVLLNGRNLTRCVVGARRRLEAQRKVYHPSRRSRAAPQSDPHGTTRSRSKRVGRNNAIGLDRNLRDLPSCRCCPHSAPSSVT